MITGKMASAAFDQEALHLIIKFLYRIPDDADSIESWSNAPQRHLFSNRLFRLLVYIQCHDKSASLSELCHIMVVTSLISSTIWQREGVFF